MKTLTRHFIQLLCFILISFSGLAQNVEITVTVDTNGLTSSNLSSKITLSCLRDNSTNCGSGSTLSDFVALIEPNDNITWGGYAVDEKVKIKGIRIKNNASAKILSKNSYGDLGNGKVKAKSKWSTKPTADIDEYYDIEVKVNDIRQWVDPKLRMKAS